MPPAALGRLLGSWEPGVWRFLGTCFLFRNASTVLTAAHCVRNPPLELKVHFPFAPNGPSHSVGDVQIHPEADVARLALIEPMEHHHVPYYSGPIQPHFQGQPLIALGFPEQSTAAGPGQTMRVFSGTLQRWCLFENTGGAPFRALETSFASPSGLSGGPVVTTGHEFSVAGVMCNNLESRTETVLIDEHEENGVLHREVVWRLIEYGIAVDLWAVADWLGPA
jgi:hypothetical protein